MHHIKLSILNISSVSHKKTEKVFVRKHLVFLRALNRIQYEQQELLLVQHVFFHKWGLVFLIIYKLIQIFL